MPGIKYTAGPTVIDYKRNLNEIGAGIAGKAVTATLYVSPNGSNGDGRNWVTAFTTIQAALSAASTDVNECTLILVGINTGSNFYDINTTGDPTFTGNYIIKGSHRTWTKIKNTHVSATSILKFTNYVSLIDLNFNLGSGSTNGVIITKGAFRVYHCQFVGSELTGTATALSIDGTVLAKHGKVHDCHFKGSTSYMKGLLLNNTALSIYSDNRFHECETAVQITHANSDENVFKSIDIGTCTSGIDIDAGSLQHFNCMDFHETTINIDDEVGDHIWEDIHGEFDVSMEPDDFTGVEIPTGDGANAWTAADVEVRAAGVAVTPFRVLALHSECDASEKFRVRLTADGGTTYFEDVLVEGSVAAARRTASAAPSGTSFIFNRGTQIAASSKSESAGIDNAVVWLEVQEI